MIKYRVHEVAKDFGLTSKEIIKVLEPYGLGGKNHMTTLTTEELNIIFETFTQNNQVQDLKGYFASGEQQVAKPEPKQEPVKKAQPAPPKTEKKVRVVDTKGVDVDLSKFDEKLETLVPEKAAKVAENSRHVQKLKKTNNRGPYANKGGNRRFNEQDTRKKREMPKPKPVEVQVPETIAVGEFAQMIKVAGVEVIKKLMGLGVMASLSDTIDYDTAAIVGEELGAKVSPAVVVTLEDKLFDNTEDKEEDLVHRSPVVVVMGHVDHGKTSLLDAIRNANVTAGEAGGITQHIGAYRVKINGQDITFLDTPGHEAFTAMRMRGAMVTDIAILVVAADDGIMPQTIEAINHAKAAGVSIIVAINKIDKESANPERVKQELTEHELVPEEWGGDTICVPVSAKNHTGIDELLEMVLLVAEVKDLKANPNRRATGTVIEAKLDKGRGPVATVLVQNGTLHAGDVVIAGTAVGRVRVMLDHNGKKLQQAGPSVPVEIVGLSEVPDGGDSFAAVTDERMARELVEQRKEEQKLANTSVPKVSLEDLFKNADAGEVKELNVIVKADVQGSVEAVKQSLEKISNDEVKVRCIHGGVGGIRESDVMLANASSAIIVGFNVVADAGARASAEKNGVDIRTYRVIYDAIDEITAAMKGMLAPTFKETVIGHAEVRSTFKVSGVGTVAGCYMVDGKMQRNAKVKITRDGIVIHEGEIASLKRFKDDVKEVAQGFECGIGIEKFNDIKEGDLIEGYIMEEVKR
ncbi:MAG: translation initiation factor IF-2 [Eubacteriales bacterium]|jgi:translation initiation factor IF-2